MENYKSWIPTVAGRLSFRLFGQTDFPFLAKSANICDNGIRRIAVAQRRYLSDSIISSRLFRWLHYSLDADFVFACCATAEADPGADSDSMTGMLFIFRSAREWLEVKSEFDRLRARVDRILQQAEIYRSESLKNDFASVQRKFQRHAIYYADFKLCRNGIVSITVPDQPAKALAAPKIPEGSAIRHNLASQLFFFLRDIGHRHQHHHAATDTIVDLYDDKTPEWGIEVLRSLYRKVIRSKREGALETYSAALGITSYIASFRKILDKEFEYDPLPGFNDKELANSIEYKRDALDAEIRRKENRRTHTIILILTFAGVLLAYLGLLGLTEAKEIIAPSLVLVEGANLALARPFWFVSTISLAAFIAIRALFTPPDVAAEANSRFVVRALSPFNKIAAIGITIALAGLVVLMIVWGFRIGLGG